MTAQHVQAAEWIDVCGIADIPVERGVAVLVDGVQIALFRTYAGDVFALSNRDPFSGANVLARGIVGTRGGVPTVASPVFKQVFALDSGACLDDPAVHVATYAVRTGRERVEVLL